MRKNQRLGVEIEVDFYTWWSPYYKYFVKSTIILTAQLLENVEVMEERIGKIYTQREKKNWLLLGKTNISQSLKKDSKLPVK